MAKDWYQGRAPRGRGLVYKDARIGLFPDDWERLDKLAAKQNRSRSYQLSSIVRSYLRENEQLRAGQAASEAVKALLKKGIEEARK